MATYQSNKPAIFIYKTTTVSEQLSQQVTYGIEEEGIPFYLETVELDSSTSLVYLAYQAAQHSPLSVGLSMNDTEIVLHYRNLQVEQFVYRIKSYQHQPLSLLRILGTNAAKLVKGTPLIVDERLESSF